MAVDVIEPTLRRQQREIFPCVLCGAAFLVQFASYGFYKGFGSIYVALQDEFKENDALIAWIGSLSYSMMFFLTPVTFKIYEFFGYRISILVGGIIYWLSLIISSFATSIYILYITIGIVFALGQSLCCFAPLFILPLYFKKNASLAHGIAVCGNSLGGLAHSPAIGFLMKKYGFSKGLRLYSFVSLPVIAMSFLFKRPEESFGINARVKKRDIKKTDSGRSNKYQLLLQRNKAYILFIICSISVNFGTYTPYVHLVRLAMDRGVSYSDAVFLPGIISLGNAIGKVAYGKLASIPKADKVALCQLAIIMTCLATTFVPILTTYLGLAIYSFMFGFFDGCIGAASMLIIKNLVAKEQFERAYSLYLVISCTSYLAGPPFAGYLYTISGNYSMAFFISGGLAAFGACCLFLVQFFQSQNEYFHAHLYIKVKGHSSTPAQQIFSFMDYQPTSEPSSVPIEDISKHSTLNQSLLSLVAVDRENDMNENSRCLETLQTANPGSFSKMHNEKEEEGNSNSSSDDENISISNIYRRKHEESNI